MDVLITLLVLLTSPPASRQPCGKKSACQPEETCVYKMTDRCCGRHFDVNEYICLSKEGLDQIQMLAATSDLGVPIVMDRTRTALTEFENERHVDQARPERIVGACAYNVQCGFHGFCVCRKGKGVCQYDENTYQRYFNTLLPDPRLTDTGFRQRLRFYLNELRERDARFHPGEGGPSPPAHQTR